MAVKPADACRSRAALIAVGGGATTDYGQMCRLDNELDFYIF